MTENVETADLSALEQKFISQEDLEKSELKTYIERIMLLCKIDGAGMVRINKEGLTTGQQIALVLATRYLANRLHTEMGKDSKITGNAKSEELAKILKMDKASVQARAKELKDKDIIESPAQGVYQIIPSKILQVMDDVEKKNKIARK